MLTCYNAADIEARGYKRIMSTRDMPGCGMMDRVAQEQNVMFKDIHAWRTEPDCWTIYLASDAKGPYRSERLLP
jgi:hypothetical protein